MRKLHVLVVVFMILGAIACSNDRSNLPMPNGYSVASINEPARQQDVMTIHDEAVERQKAQAEAQIHSRNEEEQNKLTDLLETLAANNRIWQVAENVVIASGLVECSIHQGHFVLAIRQSPKMSLKKIIYPSTEYGVYPQTEIYLKVGENRFTGTEIIAVTESIIQNLKTSDKAYIAWSAWPYREQLSGEIYLDGFSGALAKCESFMEKNKQS